MARRRFDLGPAIAEAKKKTDEALAKEVASLTRMTAEEVQTLFPKTADVTQLNELMKIVKSADSRNKKITKITENAEAFARIGLTLLGKFV